eukprot:CAMPEP_0184970918 /NCGR_PEP_ID=MMETSP1098-20130426/3229_1 /TAXON_ID=89044 /ORGANISM="Spumella elongata, Strain CCAP 955/1" /LENGTH=531 /DNA_ID=CAMNT_0027492917 /DNA_START=64 /DNA_END=1659 /DNA_ORIENTATION=-
MPIDTCVEKVDIFLCAKSLPKIPLLSETDAFAVVYMKDNQTGNLNQVGLTPVIKDTPNPVWSSAITLDYLFEITQEVTIRVYHYHDKVPLNDLTKHTFLGESVFQLASLVTKRDKKLTPSLMRGKEKGTLEIRAEAQTNTRDLFVVSFRGYKLANKDGFFGTSDPFLTIARLNEDNSYTVVWKSTKIDNSLNPIWSPVKIPMSSLCNGDMYRPLKIEIFDWDKSGKHQSMGVVETSVNAMLTSNEANMEVIEPDKKAKNKKYTNSGHLSAKSVSIEHRPTFTDFITGGCEISMIAAIDFTGSNGDPDMPNSLHYMSPTGAFNPYQSTLSSVGRILDNYDTDKMYPVYGFGAKVRKPDGSLSECQHCFPIYGGGLEVHGVDGILQAYKDCVTAVYFSGPTLFGPLIHAATALAAGANCNQEKQKYTILLIITDGMINDLEATKAAIIEASAQPMSIIIVGVGSADFSGMEALDSDKQLLTAGGKTAQRDVVQFVAHAGLEFSVLAQRVLAEVPDQVLNYMELHHIKPNKIEA